MLSQEAAQEAPDRHATLFVGLPPAKRSKNTVEPHSGQSPDSLTWQVTGFVDMPGRVPFGGYVASVMGSPASRRMRVMRYSVMDMSRASDVSMR